MSNFRKRAQRKRVLIHRETSNLDGTNSRFFNSTYLGSRILKISANPALQLPTDVAGLWAWWDVGVLSTLWQGTSRTTPVTGDGDPVQGWDDRSAAKFAFNALGSCTYDADGFNGLPAINFPKNAESFLAYSLTTIGTPCTFIAAMKSNEGTDYGYALVRTGTIRVYLEADVYAGLGPGFYDGTHKALGLGTAKTNAEVFSMVFGSDLKARLYENETEISTPGGVTYSDATFGTPSGLYIGFGHTQSGFKGVFRELAVFSGDVSDTDRNYVVAGMRARGGLS